MKLKTSFLALAIIGVSVFAGRAERSSPAANEGPAMSPGMMRGTMPGHSTSMMGNSAMGGSMQADDHMNSPLHRQVMSIAALPEMQTELGLSARQTADLRRLKQDLLAKSKDVAGQIAGRRRELDTLLSGDTSRTRTVKALFERIAELHAQLQYAGSTLCRRDGRSALQRGTDHETQSNVVSVEHVMQGVSGSASRNRSTSRSFTGGLVCRRWTHLPEDGHYQSGSMAAWDFRGSDGSGDGWRDDQARAERSGLVSRRAVA